MTRIFRSKEVAFLRTGTWRDTFLWVCFFGILLVVTVGWWVVLSLAVAMVAGEIAGIGFACFSAFSVTIGYALIRAADSRF